ncbi:MAG: hypothetical protein ISS48_04805, partial [Candidatus Aenigmarchaeota archaeon]|nr:hypothetical protein [Candidatus Aenigmarchaeota archaeon]
MKRALLDTNTYKQLKSKQFKWLSIVIILSFISTFSLVLSENLILSMDKNSYYLNETASLLIKSSQNTTFTLTLQYPDGNSTSFSDVTNEQGEYNYNVRLLDEGNYSATVNSTNPTQSAMFFASSEGIQGIPIPEPGPSETLNISVNETIPGANETIEKQTETIIEVNETIAAENETIPITNETIENTEKTAQESTTIVTTTTSLTTSTNDIQTTVTTTEQFTTSSVSTTQTTPESVASSIQTTIGELTTSTVTTTSQDLTTIPQVKTTQTTPESVTSSIQTTLGSTISSIETITTTVISPETIITIPLVGSFLEIIVDDAITKNDILLIKSNLTSDNETVIDGNITIFVNDSLVGVSSGEYEFLTEDLDPGYYLVRGVYNGSDYYNSSEAEAGFTLLELDEWISPKLYASSSVTRGEDVEIIAEAKGKTSDIWLNISADLPAIEGDKEKYCANFSESCYNIIKVSTNEKELGPYNITATASSENITEAVSSIMEIYANTTTELAIPDQAYKNESFRISSYSSLDNGTALDGRAVSFYINNAKIGEAATGNGSAAIEASIPDTGNYSVRAILLESGYMKLSSDEKMIQVVKSETFHKKLAANYSGFVQGEIVVGHEVEWSETINATNPWNETVSDVIDAGIPADAAYAWTSFGELDGNNLSLTLNASEQREILVRFNTTPVSVDIINETTIDLSSLMPPDSSEIYVLKNNKVQYYFPDYTYLKTLNVEVPSLERKVQVHHNCSLHYHNITVRLNDLGQNVTFYREVNGTKVSAENETELVNETLTWFIPKLSEVNGTIVANDTIQKTQGDARLGEEV